MNSIRGSERGMHFSGHRCGPCQRHGDVMCASILEKEEWHSSQVRFHQSTNGPNIDQAVTYDQNT